MNWTRLGRDADHPAGIARYLVRDNVLYVFCDGTRNRREWRENFQTRKVWAGYRVARVNRKDFEQAKDVWYELTRAGVRVRDFDRVVVGGYSRGYAIALCFAWFIAHPTYRKAIVHGWAGKRVGNRAFHKRLNQLGVVHVNMSCRWDIVPWLPPHYARGPQSWLYGFRFNPIRAHVASGKVAAMWRHLQTKEEL